MRWTAALSILALIGATPAAAQDHVARPFEGGSVTLIVGVDGANRFSDWSAGATYGGQIGYDWQRNGLVVGVEGDEARRIDQRRLVLDVVRRGSVRLVPVSLHAGRRRRIIEYELLRGGVVAKV